MIVIAVLINDKMNQLNVPVHLTSLLVVCLFLELNSLLLMFVLKLKGNMIWDDPFSQLHTDLSFKKMLDINCVFPCGEPYLSHLILCSLYRNSSRLQVDQGSLNFCA